MLHSDSVPAVAGPVRGLPLPANGELAADPACQHCGLPVPALSFDPGASEQFCCAGCRIVFGMLREHALDGYYAQRTSDEGVPPALATGRDYAEFDDPAFVERYTTLQRGERSAELLLEGVHCAACVWLVEKLPALLPGVTSCRLDYAQRLAYVTWAEGGTGEGLAPSRIAQTLDRLGYPPHPHCDRSRAELERRENRDLLLRLAVAGASAGNSMLFALALYSGAFADMDGRFLGYFRALSVLVALPSVLWSAQIFYRGALAAVRARSPHMDLPLSLGILLGAVSGTLNVLRGQGEIYFDSLTMLIFALLAARYVQRGQQRRAELGAGRAHAFTPHLARRLDPGGSVRVVPAESVTAGARVEVLAGDTFPVDGRIDVGESSVDRSWLTGEAQPDAVGPGSEVLAGTTNLSARVVVVTERGGAETRAARILREVERATLRRAPIALLADRVSGYFLAGVLLLSLLAFLSWLPAGLGTALDTAIALLIATCPCGLALATPLAVSSALGQAARAGLLIKGGACLEALSRPALIVFDKTGTLTQGKLSLAVWEGEESLKAQVKSLEECSAHPIARALAAALAEFPTLPVSEYRQRTGYGVEGTILGQRVSVGAVHAASGPLPEWADSAVQRLSREAKSPVLVALDGEVRAVLGLEDRVRPDAVATLRRLRQLGHRLALLSGDRQAVVDALVSRLGAAADGSALFEHCQGDLSPEDKLAWVEAEHARGLVFMVGDGVNDAGALAAASVGIAVHGGAEASLQAAHVFVTQPGIAPILELIGGARRSLGVIRGSLAFSLVYNLLAAGLALAGKISPLWAAVIMPLSSLTVVAHSYRRHMFRTPAARQEESAP